MDGGVWLGANFWSRAGGPRMWVRYDGNVVREELGVLAAHGCTVTRSFCFWPDFVPEPQHLDERVVERFFDFLDAHTELGLGTVPTLVVGHMSGQNWSPAWRADRDLYRDVWLVGEQAWYACELAHRFASHPAVAGWLLSNEMPLFGGAAPAADIAAWTRILVQALRAGGATQPISTGDGAWGIETSGVDNGFSLRRLAPLVDFLGPHSYPMLDDPVRQALEPAFHCELAGGFGRPVILEEFGVTSAFASERHAADYYRQVLHTTLLAGARGWLAWANTDFDALAGEDPYRHHPFELGFGLTDAAGRPKEQLRVLAEFARLVRSLAVTGWDRVAGDTALVVPEHVEGALPFTSAVDRQDLRLDLLQAYVVAREADLPVRLVRERDHIPSAPRLLLVPSAKLLTTAGTDRLAELAVRGATVHLSYFAGSTPVQRGPWPAGLDELCGVRHDLRYGLVDPIADDVVALEVVRPFGRLAPGTRLAFAAAAGSPSARSYLPVEPDTAEVLATDAHGRPALLRRRVGAGAVVLCTYPLEHLAARTPRVNPEDTWRLYDALADEAGVRRPVRVDDPRVVAGRLRTGHGEALDLFVNCSPDEVPAGTGLLGPYAAAAAAPERRDVPTP